MKSEFKMNRVWRYTLLCATTGGIIGIIALAFMTDKTSPVFGLSVFLGVGLTAYLYYENKFKPDQIHPRQSYINAAVFVGLASHFSSFLIFGLLTYLLGNDGVFGFSTKHFGEMLGSSLFLGLFSMMFLFWLSIPMYLITGFVAKKFDDEEFRANGISSEVTNEPQKVYNEELDF